MTKHEEYYQKMIDQNLKLFGRFQDLHDQYIINPSQFQIEYNQLGEQILNIIREWERKLCRDCERGQYSKFSNNLADKFWGLVRKDFAKIDFVGVK